MEENKNTMQGSENERSESDERTYTQKEVDDIISKRLARERKKYEREFAGGDAEREKALNARELKLTAREKLINAGMPSSLADVLKYDDEESLDEAISAVKDYKGEPYSGKAWGQRMGASVKPDRFREAMGLDRKG